MLHPLCFVQALQEPLILRPAGEMHYYEVRSLW